MEEFRFFFSKPLFTIIFRPKFVLLDTDAILKVKTIYESVKWMNVKNSFKWSENFETLLIAQTQLDREEIAWTFNSPPTGYKMLSTPLIKDLVTLIILIALAETSSLPPVKFLEDFAMKYQRTSIVMNLPKEISCNQVLKR